ncbi:sulfotransferase family protein [Salinibacter grassmerensis]|uniref:sulfotransferase family protein n=1 Tax=Salinibacter grassmerensis TaxID=3040353 RepID=UPI0021E8284E|nr:sulfotransferase [Salinibacter grassmerensis]
MTPLDIYRIFLCREAAANEAQIPCEQTPRNAFYLEHILKQFLGARVIHMVRDPRDVVLSQKRKWKRHFLGASNIPLTEAFRSWVNYHPLTISQLWRASAKAVALYRDHPRVRTVAFEEMLAAPEATVRGICEFVGTRFEEQMLSVRQVGSSHEEDRPDQRGIDPSRSGNWETGGLSDTEIFLCETITAKPMDDLYDYATNGNRPNPLMLILSVLLFPVKLGAAFFLNLPRMDSVGDALRRRLR